MLLLDHFSIGVIFLVFQSYLAFVVFTISAGKLLFELGHCFGLGLIFPQIFISFVGDTNTPV